MTPKVLFMILFLFSVNLFSQNPELEDPFFVDVFINAEKEIFVEDKNPISPVLQRLPQK